jgi:hypothetical protein
MRLTELDPHWVSSGGEDITQNGQPVPRREHIGVSFDCPCPTCQATPEGIVGGHAFQRRVFIPFANPPDGGPSIRDAGQPVWQREGDTFETLRLSPSILSDTAKGGCGWHGHVGKDVPGEVTSC